MAPKEWTCLAESRYTKTIKIITQEARRGVSLADRWARTQEYSRLGAAVLGNITWRQAKRNVFKMKYYDFNQCYCHHLKKLAVVIDGCMAMSLYDFNGQFFNGKWPSSVQFSSVAQSCPTLCDPMSHSTPGLPVHHQLPESTQTMSIESVMPSTCLTLCHPLHLPSVFPSIRVFPNVLAPHLRWPKYWSLSFSISPSIEYSRLISFRIGWSDHLAVQRTLKSLLQHHSLKASIFQGNRAPKIQVQRWSPAELMAQ